MLVSLDAKTGKEVWRTQIGDNASGVYMTAAPLIADGKVIIGVSGGDGPNRGFVAAYNPDSGKEIWKTYTIPAPGERGSDTWRGRRLENGWRCDVGDRAITTSRRIWCIWGVGNGYPWVGYARPGDNLYVASTVAIDVSTGTIKGHFQYTPNESWDWDEVSPPILVDYRRGGRTIKGLINFARSGYVYFLERSDGKIGFVEGMPYVKQNVFRGLDPKTGRPDVDPARKPDVGKGRGLLSVLARRKKLAARVLTTRRHEWSTFPRRKISAP